MSLPPQAIGVLLAGPALVARWAVGRWVARRRLGARAWSLVASGRPRAARAALRVARRGDGLGPDARLCEALALFWEGAFSLALARTCLAAAEASALGKETRRARAVAILCLACDSDPGAARLLLRAHRADEGGDTVAHAAQETIPELGDAYLEAVVAFHERLAGEPTSTDPRTTLEEHAAAGTRLPSGALANLYLAALEATEGDPEASRARLVLVADEAGPVFARRWARHRLEAVRRAPTSRVPVFDALDLLRAPLFSRDALDRTSASPAHAALLLLFAALVVVAEACFFAESSLVPLAESIGRGLVAVVVAFGAAALAASAFRRASWLRFVVAVATALPAFLAVRAIAHATDTTEILGFVGAWSVALAAWSMHALGRGRVRAFFVSLVLVLAITGALPAAPPRYDDAAMVWARYAREEAEEERALRTRYLLRPPPSLDAAAGALLPGRLGVAEIYFVGFAGYGKQSLFAEESLLAQRDFDERYDTRGRSIVLANDVEHASSLPRADLENLRRSLAVIGAKMNRGEDVLFLHVTSHGDEKGIALWNERGPSTLGPNDLRRALDDAGIEHRIVVVAGCHTGVFLEPLQSARTLVLTAAAPARSSYGCAVGRSATEIGDRLYRVHFANGQRFVPAFEAVLDETFTAEHDRGDVLSLPRMSIGSAIAPRLADIETRLDLR